MGKIYSYFLFAFTLSFNVGASEPVSFEQAWKQTTSNSYIETALPVTSVTFQRFFSDGIQYLRQKSKEIFETTSVDFHAVPSKKLLHPNGVCMAGRWLIGKDSNYSGFFKNGSDGLVIVRASTTLGGVLKSDHRGFALAVKLFPTADPTYKIETANFHTIEYLFGVKKDHFLDAHLSNVPKMDFPWNFPTLGIAIKVMQESLPIDAPNRRPLSPVARLNTTFENIVEPKNLVFSFRSATPKNNEIDFRHELLNAIKENGKLVLDMKVAGQTVANGQSKVAEKAKPLVIGQLELDQAVASTTCDELLRFEHTRN